MSTDWKDQLIALRPQVGHTDNGPGQPAGEAWTASSDGSVAQTDVGQDPGAPVDQAFQTGSDQGPAESQASVDAEREARKGLENRIRLLENELADKEATVVEWAGMYKVLNEKLSAVNAHSFALETREAAAEAREQKNAEEAARLSSLEKSIEEYDALQKENRALRSENARLKRANGKLSRVEAELSQTTTVLREEQLTTDQLKREIRPIAKKLERVQRELEELRELEEIEFNVHSMTTLRWLVDSGASNHEPFFEEDICSSGSGPWDEALLRKLLKDYGFKIHDCGEKTKTRNFGVILVGREDWDAEGISAQIWNCEGPVRVYPQEMFMAALACGSDPFDLLDDGYEEVPTLFEAFGHDHPVVEFLRSLEFEWPVVEVAGAPPTEGSWEQVSETPLHKAGYRAGITASLDDPERQEILQSFIDVNLQKKMYWVESDGYMASWGKPGSWERLRRMVYHIYMLIRAHKTKHSHRHAVQDWMADLAWLRNTFRDKARRFRWPGY